MECKRVVVMLVAFVVCQSLAIAQQSGKKELEKPASAEKSIKPTLVLTGYSSEISKPVRQVIVSQKQLDDLMKRHRPKDHQGPYITVDFEKHTAVAIFHGSGVCSRGMEVHSIVQEDGKTRIRFRDLEFQSGFDHPGYSPWCLIVAVKLSGTILLENDHRGLKDDPPLWKLFRELKVPNE